MGEVRESSRNLGTEQALVQLVAEAPERARLAGSGGSTTILFKDPLFIDACRDAYQKSNPNTDQ